jgi:hypothetical protein
MSDTSCQVRLPPNSTRSHPIPLHRSQHLQSRGGHPVPVLSHEASIPQTGADDRVGETLVKENDLPLQITRQRSGAARYPGFDGAQGLWMQIRVRYETTKRSGVELAQGGESHTSANDPLSPGCWLGPANRPG